MEYIKAIKGDLEGKKGKATYIFCLIETEREEARFAGSQYTEIITNHYDLILKYDNQIYMLENQKTTNCSLINLEDDIKEVIIKIDNKDRIEWF